MVDILQNINFLDSYKYAYITTRISGMRTRMITPEKFKQMLNSKNLDSLPQFLENTDYKKIPYKSLEESNKFLDEYFIQLLNKISVLAPSAVIDCIFLLKKYIKFQDLKLIVKSIISKDKTYLDILSTLTKIEPNTTSLEILDRKEFKEFKKNLLKQIEKKDLIQINYELEKQFFITIKKIIDKKKLVTVKNFMRKRIDVQNIIMKIRSLWLGFDIDCYLDYGFIKPKVIKNKTSIDALISSLSRTPYRAMFSKVMDEYNKTLDKNVLDKIMEEIFIEFSKEVKYSDRFSLNFVFWFILEKDREIRKLKAILKIISDDLPRDYFEVFAW